MFIIADLVTLNMKLSNKRVTKVLIRLHRCAGWSVPLLFTNPENRFSHFKPHIGFNKSHHNITHVPSSLSMSMLTLYAQTRLFIAHCVTTILS